MKMEIPVNAPSAGRVTKIHVREGQTVQEGQLLIELE
jgi:biotin carboxyl carrier protein